MIAIVGERQTGKTTALIEMSRKTGYPILAGTVGRAKNIEAYARKTVGCIPHVMVLSDMTLHGLLMPGTRVLVDDLEFVIERILGAKVIAASIGGVSLVSEQQARTNLAELGIWETIKLWHSERKRARSGGDGI